MSLVLKVSSAKNQALQTSMEHEFNEGGGTIGRKQSNTWVLPDEQRHLSGSHACIEYDNGNYYIIDTSTNGVFINGDDNPLGNGNKQKIEDGFQLLMGTFTIEASIKSDAVVSHEKSTSALSGADDDLFSDLLDDPKEIIKDQNDAVVSHEKLISDSLDTDDDLFSDLFDDSKEIIKDQSNVVVSHEKSTSVSLGADDDLFSDLFDDSKEIIKGQNVEPLDPLDDNSSIPVRIGSDDPFFEFDEFKSNKNSNDVKKQSVINENQSAMDGFFKPADINKLSGKTDPFDDLKDIDTKETIEDSIFDTSNDHVGIPDDWDLPSSNDQSFDDLLKGFDEPLLDVKKSNSPSVSRSLDVSKSEVSKKQVNDVQSNLSINNDSNAFLKGLGLDENSFEGGLSEQQLFLAGKLFRRGIKGTIEVLQSRAEIKNEMRMDMTTIQPIQNNPIKFAIDVDEAIKKLLMEDNKTNMDPEQAMDEVYDDIVSHQIAVISGIQASLSHVLKRFEPKNLEIRFEEKNPISASIPVHGKAKLWEAFEDLYGIIETEAEDDFNRLFGKEFSKAYDEQVKNLKKKR